MGDRWDGTSFLIFFSIFQTRCFTDAKMYCYILTLPPIKGVVILRIFFFFGDFVADLEEELFFKCGKNVETQRK